MKNTKSESRIIRLLAKHQEKYFSSKSEKIVLPKETAPPELKSKPESAGDGYDES